MSAASWTCPSCDRRVPPRVDVCRCGASRPTTPLTPASSTAPPADEDDARGATRLTPTYGVVALVALAAIAGWWWMRPAPSGAPRPTPDVVAAPQDATPALERAAVDSRPEPPASAARTDATTTGESPVTPPGAAPAPAVRSALEDVVSRAVVGVVMVDAAGSRGTGFFVAPDVIVTNAHVVGRDSAVTVRLHDGTTRMARVERTTADLDLALLRTAAVPSSLVLALGEADAARVGQEVVAIGSALGLQSTVTRGILSARRQTGAVTLLQTDAAINPGNSGGPLLDRDGAVLGVTTLKMAGAAEGLGFAVSSEHVRAFIEGRAVATRAGRDGTAPIAPSLGSGLDASAEGQRAAGTAAFGQHLQQLAQQAAQIDTQWARVEAACRPDLVREGDRAWFALATRTARVNGTDPNCPYWLADLQAASRAFGEAFRTVAEQARRAGVYPGDQRTMRRQWRLDWSGFDR